MSWTLVWTRPALRDMKKLEQRSARRIREALVRLTADGQTTTFHTDPDGEFFVVSNPVSTDSVVFDPSHGKAEYLLPGAVL